MKMLIIPFRPSIILCPLLVLHSVGYSTDAEVRQIIESLVKMKSWIINFEEEIIGETGTVGRKTGKILFRRPLNFKIEYPDSAILSDGKSIYFIFDRKRKVYVKDLREEVSQSLIIEVLAGSDSILDFFTVTKLKQGVFELKPKENSIKQVDSLRIYSLPTGFPISQIEITHKKNFKLRFRITKVQFRDVNIDFSLPENFEVIDERRK